MFNKFFCKTVPNINIDNKLKDNITNPNITDPAVCAIQKYENRPSILKIKEMTLKKTYHFLLNFLIERRYSMNYKI